MVPWPPCKHVTDLNSHLRANIPCALKLDLNQRTVSQLLQLVERQTGVPEVANFQISFESTVFQLTLAVLENH